MHRGSCNIFVLKSRFFIQRCCLQKIKGPILGQPVAIIRSLAESVDNVEKVLVLAQDINSPGVELRSLVKLDFQPPAYAVLHSGCEVYIASIERIEALVALSELTLGMGRVTSRARVQSACEVETSVRRINVDDVETLGVKAAAVGKRTPCLFVRKAYDKQGNVFSSLEGLQPLGQFSCLLGTPDGGFPLGSPSSHPH